MAMIEVSCPDCQSRNVIKAGKRPNGTQRYRCQNPTCPRTIFQLAYVAHGRLAETRRQIVEMALLVPFGSRRFYPDGWGAYKRHLARELHEVGKHHTQQLERKHLTLRTRIKRLVRKTLCFSKSTQMPDLVIGLFINRFEFGVTI